MDSPDGQCQFSYLLNRKRLFYRRRPVINYYTSYDLYIYFFNIKNKIIKDVNFRQYALEHKEYGLEAGENNE
jgi:hypothetical protein